jgi:DNA-binding NarL/FixJ family response regulator
MTKDIRVLVVDDHALVRGALSDRLRREPDIEIVGTAATADEAIDVTLRTAPHVILMDIDMPGQICFDAALTIATTSPDARIIFLSAFLHDMYVQRAIEVKAHGYVSKHEPPETVLEAIRAVAAGEKYYSERVRARLVAEVDGARTPRSRRETLSVREIEVLRYIARGLTMKEMAKTMHLSVKTVDRHISKLMDKLAIRNRVGLARYAIREGISEP